MAQISFDLSINFRTWFERTNDLGTALGDVDNINPALGNTLVLAINSVKSKVGTVSFSGDLSNNDNLVDAINELSGQISTFRISEAEPQAYDMHPIHVFGSETDFDAHGFFE